MPVQIKHLEAQRIYFDNIYLPKSKLLIFKGVVVCSIHFSIEECAQVSIKLKPKGTLVLSSPCTLEE